MYMFQSCGCYHCHLHHLLQQNPEWFDILVSIYIGCPGNWLWNKCSSSSEWVSMVWRFHQHIIGHFGDKSYQSITCTDTDNQTWTTKRLNTGKIQNYATQSKRPLQTYQNTLKTSRIRYRTHTAFYDIWPRNGLILCFQPKSPHGARRVL